MKRIIAMVAATVVAIGCTVTTYGTATWYVNAHSGLNCRTAPTAAAEIITTYTDGTELEVIGTDGGDWWEVWDGTLQGWCFSEFLTNELNEADGNEDMTYLGTMWVTEYTPDPAENGGASVDRHGRSLAPQVGEIVAVDGKTIPWDRTIYIDGVGYRRTADSGVIGRAVDVLSWGDTGVTGYRDVWLVIE